MAKIEQLREICPGILDPGVTVVGITDTSYGEDHCWAEHFTCVVDLNSPTPFPPIVPQASPTRAVHSAIVLTDEEQRRRNNGNAGDLDPRRKGRGATEKVDLDREGLSTRLGDVLAEINRLTASIPSLAQQWEAAHALNQFMEASRATLTTAIKIG
ncbi:MAG: hypothetical protein WCF10_15430 [Polyangiales bacterium]